MKYSVIVPTYNRADTITRALDSVLSQGCNDKLEILIIDDKSEDSTVTLYNDVMAVDHKEKGTIKLVSLDEHIGKPGLVRNKGVENAKGEYICFCDSDDRWLPNHLATIDKAIEEDPSLEFVRTRAQHTWLQRDKNGKPIEHRIEGVHDVDVSITNSIVIKKEAFLRLGGFDDGEWGEDQRFWGVCQQKLKCRFIKEVTTIYSWVKGGNNLTYKYHPKFKRIFK